MGTTNSASMASRALILRQKTQRPVPFEITEPTRDAVSAWIKNALNSEDILFPATESPDWEFRVPESWLPQLIM